MCGAREALDTATGRLRPRFCARQLIWVVTPEAISSDGKTGLAWVPDLQPLAAWDEAERNWRSS